MTHKIAIVGVGLMGGSLAAALRAGGFASEIVGIDTNAESLAFACKRGLIDRAAAFPAVSEADIIVLATPVGVLPALLRDITALTPARTVITDMGSVKAPVTAAAEALGLRSFVPAHPIAGAEHAGPEGADAALFQGRAVILTPTADQDPDALALVEALWRSTGARLVHSDARRHDELVAYTSHLPHVLAFACAELLDEQGRVPEWMPFAGSGLRDFLRIAGSDPVMWRDICQANRQALACALQGYSRLLGIYGEAIAAGDEEGLRAHFTRARQLRRQLNGEEIHGDN
ncbi:MAG: prephenate dehydrogenase/arogenate dehydrogenase family protein [Gammaproteobacteria bacterium]|nr:prephenate dehydrogenase/arogenate dehydrogenase family protein [Gammaproteobacteria bacterium]